MKSKLIYLLNDENGYGKTAFYEYRGYEYMIHYCNNGCMDDMNVGREHKKQQEMIDCKIKNIGNTNNHKVGSFDFSIIDLYYE